MMVLYSKVSDVEKAQHNDQNAPKVSQEQLAAQEIKRKEVEQTQVMESPEGEGAGRIKEEPERKRGGNRGGREEDQAEEQSEETGRPKPLGKSHSGSIDIIA